MAVWPTAYVCGLFVVGMTGSNLAQVMDLRLLCVLSRWLFLRWVSNSFRRDLPGVCLIVCDPETSITRQPRHYMSCSDRENETVKIHNKQYDQHLYWEERVSVTNHVKRRQD